MEMPKILECGAIECAYNRESQCHALAITVGNSSHPRCDTYWTSSGKGGDLTIIGSVGACRASTCRFNQDLECTAPGIRVGHAGPQIDCLTFQAAG